MDFLGGVSLWGNGNGVLFCQMWSLGYNPSMGYGYACSVAYGETGMELTRIGTDRGDLFWELIRDGDWSGAFCWSVVLP